jgi:hypothetical protein
MIRTQTAVHNKSQMVAVLGTPCAIPPRNSNSNYMKTIVFWVTAPCSLEVDRRFTGAYCLHNHLWNVGLLQRDYTALYPRKLSLLFIIDSILRLINPVHNFKPYLGLYNICRSQCPRGLGRRHSSLGCWVHGFESRLRYGRLSSSIISILLIPYFNAKV